MKLLWKPSFSTSALHSAYTIAFGLHLVDRRVEESLRGPAFGLHAFASGLEGLRRGDSSLTDLLANQRRAKRLWDPLLALSSDIDGNQALAQAVVKHCLGEVKGSSSNVDSLAGWITEIEAATRLLFPKLVEQLELRSRPLRELWDGYGQGLMAHIRRMTSSQFLTDQAEVVLIQPVLGGFGECHPLFQKVRMEAVLANPIPELPEVVRLAWLLSQLRSSYMQTPNAKIPVDRAIELHRLAILPAVLAAAQLVELSRVDEEHVALAIEQWHIPVPAQVPVSKQLMAWWETYLQTKPDWDIGLMALDRMLST